MEKTQLIYPSDISDANWEQTKPYLERLSVQSGVPNPQSREFYNGMRYIAHTGLDWKFLPRDFPPFKEVLGQLKRWQSAEGFRTAPTDLRTILNRARIPTPPKKLLLFLDGTSNSAAGGHWSDRTNLFRLALAFHYRGNQIVHYMPGVGTRGDILSAATAQGFDEILREAYVNLASNHMLGDEVFIFGYSRGGAIALALADMISKVGLLWADYTHELGVVWDIYLHHIKAKLLPPRKIEELESKIADKIRISEFAPQISYLGLFDPVPGNAWDKFSWFSQSRLDNIKLPKSVGSAFSILSIDDNRKPSFSPIVIEGKSNDAQQLEQVWMPGVHADIGGDADATFLSDVALLTMIEDVISKFSHLYWDDNLLNKLREQFSKDVHIIVSYERKGVLRKFLLPGSRRIGKTSCQFQGSGNEKLHIVYEYLFKQSFLIKGRTKRYSPTNVPSSMATYKGYSADMYKLVIEKAFRVQGKNGRRR